MHNYTLSVTRESTDDYVSFPFSFEATVTLPDDALWRAIIESMVDHSSSWLWPTQYSKPTVDSIPPRLGSRLVLAYQIPNPNNPGGPKKNATYEFEIVAFDDAVKTFEYRATADHPFLRGGGVVSVSSIDAGTSRLRWKGRYQHAAGQKGKEAQGEVFAYFLCMFFTAMAQNIKRRMEGEIAPRAATCEESARQSASR